MDVALDGSYFSMTHWEAMHHLDTEKKELNINNIVIQYISMVQSSTRQFFAKYLIVLGGLVMVI